MIMSLAIEMEKIRPYLHAIAVASLSAFITVLFLPKMKEIVNLKSAKKDTPIVEESPIVRRIIKGFNGYLPNDLLSLKSKEVITNNEIKESTPLMDNVKQEKAFITYRLFKDGSRSKIVVSILKSVENNQHKTKRVILKKVK